MFPLHPFWAVLRQRFISPLSAAAEPYSALVVLHQCIDCCIWRILSWILVQSQLCRLGESSSWSSHEDKQQLSIVQCSTMGGPWSQRPKLITFNQPMLNNWARDTSTLSCYRFNVLLTLKAEVQGVDVTMPFWHFAGKIKDLFKWKICGYAVKKWYIMLEKNITKLFQITLLGAFTKGKTSSYAKCTLSVTKVSRNLIPFFTFRQTCRDVLSRKSTEKENHL